MKQQMTVKKVLELWREFLDEHGGRENLHANVIWLWPNYIRARERSNMK